MAAIIDGKAVAGQVREELRQKAAILKQAKGIAPGLAVILVGDDPASQVYVRGKRKACDEAGFLSREYRLPAETPETEVLRIIGELNADPEIHGILVQMPVPPQIRPEAVVEAIDPRKDVDGLHPFNAGRLFSGDPFHKACTPSGVIELMDRYGIPIEGKEAVIVGRSNLVGKPLSLMLLARHATVTICHTRTRDLGAVCRRAEILVAAAGKAGMIRGDMVRDGAVVIDVGINRVEGRLLGDVAFQDAEPRASWITPVPGGVGPMTIAMLLANTYRAAERATE
ncbi:MAG: bifunctional methylenetetrahydrofolate dehydrogenase/methenyltetrahydrofolate cyclohydrolase FolD [Syntrophaceae bacterium]|nr:bifunctional methylenetetrahydrofolate dehydrogenase/methenyltetrahydrofolate cyclohydrolase FolD [Syntrophaceae bacterium]